MKIVSDTWRGLVQRRLWPVALLLLGALVAVPFVLGKSPAPAAPAAAAPATNTVNASAASADPIVSPASDDESATARRTLGDRHNPFAASGPKTKAKKAKAEQTSDAPSADTSSASGPSSGGTSVPTTPTTPTTSITPTTPTTSTTPTETVPTYSIHVRFGSSDAKRPRRTLERDEALPNKDEPVLVYLGVKHGGKTAVFMLGEGVTATGDGACKPKDSCETIELQAGETEHFDVAGQGEAGGTQYKLDLIKIHRHATKVPATSDSSSSPETGTVPAATSSSLNAGRRAIRAHVAKNGPLPYRYDRRSGTLRRR